MSIKVYELLKNPREYVTEDQDIVLSKINGCTVMIGTDSNLDFDDNAYFIIEDDETSEYRYKRDCNDYTYRQIFLCIIYGISEEYREWMAMTIKELLGYLVQVEDIEKPIIALGDDDYALTVVGVTEISNGVIFSLDILDDDEVEKYNNKKTE